VTGVLCNFPLRRPGTVRMRTGPIGTPSRMSAFTIGLKYFNEPGSFGRSAITHLLT
jgi:hypothetical protein